MHRARHSLEEIDRLSSAIEGGNDLKILHCVTDLFFLTLEQQQSTDMAIFGDVMEHIAYQLAIAERAELSERMSEASSAPQKLILRLANDAIEVARPILRRSTCLREEDLIAIMRSCTYDHIVAVAERPHLSEAMTDVIVETECEQLVADTAQNAGAKFSLSAFKRLTEIAASATEVLAALLARDDVPEDVAKRIRSDAQKKGWTDPGGTSSPGPDVRASDKPRTLRVNESKLAKFADAGESEAVARCLSEVMGIDSTLLKGLLFEADLSALIVICKSHQFERSTFASLFHLRQKSNSKGSPNFANAMRRYHEMDVRSAELFLRILRDKESAKARNESADRDAHDSPQ